jgi:hypothetical protein
MFLVGFSHSSNAKGFSHLLPLFPLKEFLKGMLFKQLVAP